MKFSKGFLLVFFLLVFSSDLFSQTGSLRGNVSETFAGKNEPIIGAIISLEGTDKAAVSDTAGHFFIQNIPPGKYDVKISYIGYNPKTIKGVEVKDGQTANLPKIQINEDVLTTEEVEIIGTRDKGSDVSMIQEIKTLDVVASGISSEQIRRTMDRDAADVAARVSGVSVVDNRFVIVRGLSERYNAVMINDVLAPSFEQDVKSFSLDNIRSNFIDRMIVYKSPSPDLPGDFAGGVVKIFTLGMPVKNEFSAGFSSSYRQGTTFNDFKKLPQGKNGWLGYDDGTYSYPKALPPDYNTGGGSIKYDAFKIGSNFRNDTWTPTDTKADPDIRFNINNGYRLKLGGNKVLGIVTGINYSKVMEKWNDARQALFDAVDSKGGSAPLLTFDNLDVSARTVRFSALQNFVLQLRNSNSIEWKNMYTHTGLNRYRNAYRYGVVPPASLDDKPTKIVNYNSDVSVANSFGGIYTSQLVGKFLVRKNTDVNWIVGYAKAERDEPDLKNFQYNQDLTDGRYSYRVTSGSPTPVNFGRMFFKTEEFVRTVSTDISHRTVVDFLGQIEMTLKGGWYLENKTRSFGLRTFGYTPQLVGPSGKYNDADISDLSPDNFSKESTWNNYDGLAISPASQNGAYTAKTDLYAFYGMTKLNWNEKLTVTGGMRLENYTRLIVGSQLFVQNWLPSINASYNFSKKMLVRGSFGKTVNRPELREAARFTTYDYYVRTNINGNPKLKPSLINNFDLRLEFYPSPEQAFTIGVFYKEFQKPIDRILIQPTNNEKLISNYDISFLNGSRGYSKGIEAEARTSFKNILLIKDKDYLKNFSLIFNGSLLQSRIIYDQESLAESGVLGLEDSGEMDHIIKNRERFLSMNSKRTLLGQSPYMINAGLTYKNDKFKNMVNISYNVFGTRLFAVIPGLGAIYEVPRHVIDLAITQNIGKNIEIKFGIQDILNQKIQFMQDLNDDGKVKRVKGTGYETDLNNSKTIYQNSSGGSSNIYTTSAPSSATPLQLKTNTYDVKDTEFLGYKRGSYFTLGVTLRF
ncbi:MAG: TonB-dependent receptor [Opitutaceae bacterium]|nr:TonB-dependent receptor [Cytophagales bacterium]